MFAIHELKRRAALNAFWDLAAIALECGDIDGAKSRIQEAREILDEDAVLSLISDLESEYRVELSWKIK